MAVAFNAGWKLEFILKKNKLEKAVQQNKRKL